MLLSCPLVPLYIWTRKVVLGWNFPHLLSAPKLLLSFEPCLSIVLRQAIKVTHQPYQEIVKKGKWRSVCSHRAHQSNNSATPSIPIIFLPFFDVLFCRFLMSWSFFFILPSPLCSIPHSYIVQSRDFVLLFTLFRCFFSLFLIVCLVLDFFALICHFLLSWMSFVRLLRKM